MNIVENGKDSFQKCVKTLLELESLSPTDPTYNFKLKNVIINLHHSTEVLFKYLVSKKSDFLVYAAPLEAVKNAFNDIENGRQFDGSSQNTIQFLDAVHLVYVLYNLDIKPHTKSLYEDLNSKRNAITHYTHEFSVEHTLNSTAFLLIELYGIYAKYIEDFEQFAKDAHLNKNITNIKNKASIDMLEINLNLLKSVIKALDEFDTNKTNIRQILDNRVNDLHYNRCIVCGKSTFKVKSHFIVTHELVSYIGACDICKFNVGYDNAPVVVHHCNAEPSLFVDNLINVIMQSLNRIVESISNYSFKVIETLVSKYKKEIDYLIGKHRDKLERIFRTSFEYFLDDIYKVAITEYFEKNYYYYNDVIEDLALYKDSKLCIELNAIKGIIEDLPAYEFNYKYLKILNKIDTYNSKSIISSLIKNITKTHVSYHPAMYKNGHTNEDIWIEVDTKLVLEESERAIIENLLLEQLINVDDSEVNYEARDPYDH